VTWACRGAGLWLSALALLLGCSDGYPGKERPLISPFDMRNEQRLTALNLIGAHAHRERRWRFALVQGCELQLTHERKGARAIRRVFQLERRMEVDVVFDKADQTFDVQLMASADDDAPHLGTLLESPAWTDAVQADLLLQLLIRDCVPSGAIPLGQ
jgi:hypothetical protein